MTLVYIIISTDITDPSLGPAPPNCPSLLAGPQGYIPYLHRAAVCRFEPFLCSAIDEGVHNEYITYVACPYFSSSVLHVWFI